MAIFYYAEITYHSGDKVTIVHRGKEPTKATMRFLSPIAASILVGDPLPQDKQELYGKAEEAAEERRRNGWHPRMDESEEGDDGDD